MKGVPSYVLWGFLICPRPYTQNRPLFPYTSAATNEGWTDWTEPDFTSEVETLLRRGFVGNVECSFVLLATAGGWGGDACC